MRSLQSFAGVFIHRDPVDMRKSINGLCELVQSVNMGDLMKPHLFVFSGRRRNVIKILYFDKSGFCLWQKRLEADRFIWPKKSLDNVVRISSDQLSWLLDGYDVWKMKPFSAFHFEKVS